MYLHQVTWNVLQRRCREIRGCVRRSMLPEPCHSAPHKPVARSRWLENNARSCGSTRSIIDHSNCRQNAGLCFFPHGPSQLSARLLRAPTPPDAKVQMKGAVYRQLRTTRTAHAPLASVSPHFHACGNVNHATPDNPRQNVEGRTLPRPVSALQSMHPT